MLNALYLTAEQLGVEILYDAEVLDLQIDSGMFLSAELKARRSSRGRYRLDAGRRRRRLRGQRRMAQGILGRGRR
jgi:phytoene dehydrogenase-like protein